MSMKIIAGLALLTSLASAQTVDKSFWTVAALNGGATALDSYTTVIDVGHTRHCAREEGTPQLYGSKPETPRVSFVMGSLYLASTAFSYGLKLHRIHIWKVPLWTAPSMFMGEAHLQGAIYNLSHCH